MKVSKNPLLECLLLGSMASAGLTTGCAAGGSVSVKSVPVKSEGVAAPVVQQAVAVDFPSVWPASRNRWIQGDGARDLPTSWSVDEGAENNVLWSVALGSETYGGPVVTSGIVLVGTNNASPRDPGVVGDRGVLMAFERDTGQFRWQSVHQKGHPALPADSGHGGSEAFDWPEQGVCSTPTVYRIAGGGEAIAFVSNRGELVSLDLEGRRRFVVDMVERYEVVPHFMSASSPLIVNDRLFVLTGNGPDEQGSVPAPDAASFVAVDSSSGDPVWQSSAPTEQAAELFEGQWSSPVFIPPTSGVITDGTVVFPGGNGVLYGFSYGGDELFAFDANATLETPPESWQAGAFIGTPVWYEESGESTTVGKPGLLLAAVGRNPEGGASGRGQLLALEVEGDDASGRATIAEAWRFRDPDLGFALASVVVGAAAVYVADLNGFLFAVDRESGKEIWRYDARAPIWASPLVAGGRVYLADSDGDVTVLLDAPELSVVSEVAMGESVFASPMAMGDKLFLATRSRLWALAEGR